MRVDPRQMALDLFQEEHAKAESPMESCVSWLTGERGCDEGRVSTLVKEGKLDTVLVDGRSRVTIASVNARLANPPAPHRPKANG